MVADRRLHRRRTTGEWNVHGLHLGDLGEEVLRGDMGTGTDAGAAEGEALVLAVGEELLQVLRRIARMDREHVGAECHDRNRAQVAGGEALVPPGGLVDRKRRRGGQDGVTIGCRGAHGLGRDIAAGTAAVFHDHGVL